ncbi:MAG: signal peptidase I [Patescibacteria group bacterium]|nr:signal peptidase I [Patescibacteria group bacterium]
MLDFAKKIGNFFLDTIETVVIALAIFVVIYLFLVQPHQIKGSSMYPTFYDGEYILTDKISYRFFSPSRGDVIILLAPKNHELDYIKRIIALPGEKVMVKNGRVYINDSLLNEPYLSQTVMTYAGAFLHETQDFTVPDKEYIVMGDNREHSSDSREWGTVKRNEIIGKAWLRYWPLNRISFIPHISY